MALVTLRRGGLELDLCPRFGGAIARFRFRGHDLLRPAGTALTEDGDPLAASGFPLVPFSGRIENGRFSFGGEEHRLEPNFPPEPHAIHGQGWQLPWEVVHAAEALAELTLEHRVPATPLEWRARQTFELVDDGLTVGLTLTNAGQGPMPAGIGLHPYFPRTPAVTLQARLGQVWLNDEGKIPRERVALPETWDFSTPQEVNALEMDNCFAGWDGKAQIVWPEIAQRLTIEADPLFGHLVIYIPQGADFFCVEPVSHASNGFNLQEAGVEGTGVRILEPGETLEGMVRFRVA
jgi:aldose 1-epimerase